MTHNAIGDRPQFVDALGNPIEPGDELILQTIKLAVSASGRRTPERFMYAPVVFGGCRMDGTWILFEKCDDGRFGMLRIPCKPRLFQPGCEPKYVTPGEAVEAFHAGDRR